jgi:hypothetical protein
MKHLNSFRQQQAIKVQVFRKVLCCALVLQKAKGAGDTYSRNSSMNAS